ncbi:hypothetical protein [Nocardia sp. NPDC051750]|uniref:hypothetical protein n=1 Tax=Nocardia sp. NPDC051750 TaxID=3364325 RepID=UPI0037962B8A
MMTGPTLPPTGSSWPPIPQRPSPPPPKKHTNTLWLLGGLGTVIVIVVAAVAIIITRSDTGVTDPAARAINSDTGTTPEAPHYTASEDVCERTDISKVPSEFHMPELEGGMVSQTEGQCRVQGDPDPFGKSFILSYFVISETNEEAESEYLDIIDTESGEETPESFTGDWDEAEIVFRNETNPTIVVRDANLVFKFVIFGPMVVETSIEDGRKAATELAEAFIVAASESTP